MRRIIPFLLIYVLIQSGGQTIKATWSDNEPVDSLLQGQTYQIVSRETFDATPNPLPPTPEQILAAQRGDALNGLNIDASGNAKLVRSVLLLLLDRINLLQQRDDDRSTDVAASTSLSDLKTRWAARSAMGQITVQQAKTAVSSKINSGASD